MKDLLTLTKIKNGDVKAFEEVFRLYYMPLCMYAAGITGRMDIAEEIVQELFYVFWSIGNIRMYETATRKPSSPVRTKTAHETTRKS